MEIKKLELVIFSVFFVGLSIVTYFVFRPFLYIIVLAAVLSILFNPAYKRLVEIFHGGRSFFAIILVIVALVFLILPFLFFGLQISGQAQSFFSLTQANQGQYMHLIQQNIDIFFQHFIPTYTFNISDTISRVLAYIPANIGGLLSQTTYVFFQIFFLLFTLFFFLRDGDKILESIISLSPFAKEQNKEVTSSVYKTVTSVIRGTLFVGLIRFILFSIVFYYFGIPDALLWGSIGGIIGMVPGLGTPFVIIPAFIYLLLYGNIYLAIGMLVFGILISIFIDNMLSAYYFGKGLDVPPFLILFSILGGVIYFGPLGFVFGPIILSLFISMIDIYKILILKKS